MMHNAITVLFVGMCLVAFIQPNAPRFFAAVSFVSITLLHELFLSDYDGLLYYGTAALFDLAIIILTSGINPVPKMVLSLHRICIVSILANFLGWVIWFFYLPPTAYDTAFVAIYAWALMTLINRNGLDVGGYTLASWNTCFRFNRSAWVHYFNKHDGKV